VVEERSTRVFQNQWFVDAGTVGVSRHDVITAVEFEQDVFVVIDVPRDRRADVDDLFLDTPAQAIVFIIRRGTVGHGSHELVLGVVFVRGEWTGSLRRLNPECLRGVSQSCSSSMPSSEGKRRDSRA